MLRKSIAALLVLCFPAIPWADVVPLGDERVVGTAPDDDHYLHSLDSAALGSSFVVSWNSAFTRYSGSQPYDWGGGVAARRIAADGQPAGRLAPVPEAHKIDITGSALATDAAGRFAVVWDSANEHHPHTFLWLRQFSPAGAALSTVRLAQTGPGFGLVPPVSVAMSTFGRALAVWGREPASSSPFPAGLWGQLFLPSGAPATPRFSVTPRPVSFRRPALATDARGSAVVVYESPGNERSTLYLRRYDRNGQAQGGEVRLVTATIPGFGLGVNPALSVQANGRFALVWQELGRIRARVFDPPYRPLGPAFEVNAGRDAIAGFPDVALRDGRLLVAWMEAPVSGVTGPSIWARAFDSLGAPLGEAVRVDDARPLLSGFGDGAGPTVAAGPGGTFLVSWGRTATEGGLSQVVSRLYAVEPPG